MILFHPRPSHKPFLPLPQKEKMQVALEETKAEHAEAVTSQLLAHEARLRAVSDSEVALAAGHERAVAQLEDKLAQRVTTLSTSHNDAIEEHKQALVDLKKSHELALNGTEADWAQRLAQHEAHADAAARLLLAPAHEEAGEHQHERRLRRLVAAEGGGEGEVEVHRHEGGANSPEHQPAPL